MRFPTNFAALIFCCLALYANASDQISHSSPVKIICIGDSITQGGNNKDEYTYRLPLYRLLKQKGVNAIFVGAHTEGLNAAFHWPGDFDAHHESFYGATTDFVRQALIADLPKLPAADIAIIDLGSNDHGKDIEKEVINPLTDIISQLRAQNPQVKILIIQIPGIYQNLGMHVSTWRMARRLSQPRSPIRTVPLYLAWNTKDDTIDGEHPNIKGQNKMAAAIYSELEPLLQAK
jgi:lysophospholipase L1-like esterase